MTYTQFIKHFGGQAKAAEAMGWHRQRVNRWKNGIPLEAQMDIEMKTKGALRADIPQRLIRMRLSSYLETLGHDIISNLTKSRITAALHA